MQSQKTIKTVIFPSEIKTFDLNSKTIEVVNRLYPTYTFSLSRSKKLINERQMPNITLDTVAQFFRRRNLIKRKHSVPARPLPEIVSYKPDPKKIKCVLFPKIIRSHSNLHQKNKILDFPSQNSSRNLIMRSKTVNYTRNIRNKTQKLDITKNSSNIKISSLLKTMQILNSKISLEQTQEQKYLTKKLDGLNKKIQFIYKPLNIKDFKNKLENL